MRILAIDPGLKGGLAWQLSHDGAPFKPKAIPMPTVGGGGLDEAKLAEVFWLIVPEIIIIERVQNLRGVDADGERTRKMGASSMFAFGEGYGVLRGIVAMYSQYQMRAGKTAPLVHYPTPQQWKKVILPGAGKGKVGAIAYCQQHFPTVDLVLPGCRKPHDGMADALCLLRYGQKIAEKLTQSEVKGEKK